MLKTNKHKIYQKLGWRDFLDSDINPRAEQFLETRGYDVLHQITSNIHNAIKPDWQELSILVHPNSTSIMSIKKDEFKEVLEFCMKWFIENEHYESCQLVLDAQKRLGYT